MFKNMSKSLSKKMTVIVSSVLGIIVTDVLGIPLSPDVLYSVAGMVIVYLGGQSGIDMLKAKSK